MRRRTFLAGSLAPFISNASVAARDREPITITASGAVFTPPSGGKPWEIAAKDIQINGMTVPKFSASWIGLNLASGLLAGIGGFVFSLLEKALGFGGPSIEELLNRQLEAIAEIVTDAIKQNEIRKDSARLSAIQDEMADYMRVPASVDRLHRATADSLYLIHDLATFGFDTYGLLMCAASLRLAILQERAKRDKAELVNIQSFISWVKAYQKNTEAFIDSETDFTKRFPGAGLTFPFTDLHFALAAGIDFSKLLITKPILNVAVKDMPRVPKNSQIVNETIIQSYNLAQMKALRGPGGGLGSGILALPDKHGNIKIDNLQLFNLLKKATYDLLDKPQDPMPGLLIDWPAVRTMARQKTTVLGDKMIADWSKAFPPS